MEGKLSSSKGISNALFSFYPPRSKTPFYKRLAFKAKDRTFTSPPPPNHRILIFLPPTQPSQPHPLPILSGSPPTPPQTSHPYHPPSYFLRPFPHHQTHATCLNLSHTYPRPAKAGGIGRLGDRSLVLRPWNRVCLLQGRGCILSTFVSFLSRVRIA